MEPDLIRKRAPRQTVVCHSSQLLRKHNVGSSFKSWSPVLCADGWLSFTSGLEENIVLVKKMSESLMIVHVK